MTPRSPPTQTFSGANSFTCTDVTCVYLLDKPDSRGWGVHQGTASKESPAKQASRCPCGPLWAHRGSRRGHGCWWRRDKGGRAVERARGQGGRGQEWPRGACEEGPARRRCWSLGLASASRDGVLAALHVLGVGSQGPGVVGTPTSTPVPELGQARCRLSVPGLPAGCTPVTFRSSSSGQCPWEASTKAEGAWPGPRNPGRQRAGLRRGIHGDHLDPTQLRTPRPQPRGAQKIRVSEHLSRLTHGLHLTSTWHLPASPGLVR